MPERLANDGGTVLELRPTVDGQVGGPEIPGRVLMYYVNGTGFMAKEYGKDAVTLSSFIGASGGGITPEQLAEILEDGSDPLANIVAQYIASVVADEDGPRAALGANGLTLGDGTGVDNVTLFRDEDTGEVSITTSTGTYIITGPTIAQKTMQSVSADDTSANAYAEFLNMEAAEDEGMYLTGSLKNTGANDITVKETVDGPNFESADSVEHVVASGEYLILDTLQGAVGDGVPPYSSYVLEVKSTVADAHSAFVLRAQVIGVVN